MPQNAVKEPKRSVKEPKRSVNERIYDVLSRRLEKFTTKLSPEDQVEIDGAISIFSDDLATAVRSVVFFNLK